MKTLKDVLDEGEFEGVPFRVTEVQEFNPGDTYLACRGNRDAVLLTVRNHVKEDNLVGGYICPVEMAYAYDAIECVRIELLID